MWKTGKDHIIKFMMGLFSTKIFVKIYKNWSITTERLSQAKITQCTKGYKLTSAYFHSACTIYR